MKGLVHPKMKILSLIVTLMLFQTYTIFIHLQNFFWWNLRVLTHKN